MAFSDFPFLPATMGGLSTDDRRFPGHREVAPFALQLRVTQKCHAACMGKLCLHLLLRGLRLGFRT